MGNLVGLTGGIGSGKSSVAREFVRLGATLVDADAIVHALQAPGQPALAAIVEAFGEQILCDDGSLDRPALGAIVFEDPEARQLLGQLILGPVVAEMARQADEAVAAGAELVVLDVPLLFEGRTKGRGSSAVVDYDHTVLVWVPEATQVERTMARDACTRDAVLKRMAAQLPLDAKRELADHVIDNSGSPEATAAQIRSLYHELVQAKAR